MPQLPLRNRRLTLAAVLSDVWRRVLGTVTPRPLGRPAALDADAGSHHHPTRASESHNDRLVLGSTIERRIAEILFEHGPVMRRDDLEDIAVNERGLNRSSFYVYLGYSPIIARYAPGVYGLRGARVSAGEVNALIPPRAKTQRLVDHGWTSDGRVWIAYKMSEASLTAGVLSVPAALQEFVAGSYLLFSEQDRPVGTLVIKGSHMWGVSPFYRRWGVEGGDFVVVTIDINASRATILSGGEEMLLRFQEGD